MKKLTLLFILSILSIFVNAQKLDTIPNCYCDCIDNNEIVGDKTIFFADFELKYLKTTLKSLQLLSAKAYETYFENLYKTAFLRERRKSNLGDYYIHYPPNPVCYLLEKYLRIRTKERLQKQYYQRVTDSLKINNDIKNLKYRLWFMPSFGYPRLLEIHINPNQLNDNKAIIYDFEDYIFMHKESFDIKISRIEILETDEEKWNTFIEKTSHYNLSRFPQQSDELGFRLVLKDGYSIILQVYENGNFIHILDYQNPMKEGSKRHNKNFREFHLLTNETFDWLPFKMNDE